MDDPAAADKKRKYYEVSLEMKRRRTSITPLQLNLLNAHYGKEKYPSSSLYSSIADEAHLSKAIVTKWFQNRRARQRKNPDKPDDDDDDDGIDEAGVEGEGAQAGKEKVEGKVEKESTERQQERKEEQQEMKEEQRDRTGEQLQGKEISQQTQQNQSLPILLPEFTNTLPQQSSSQSTSQPQSLLQEERKEQVAQQAEQNEKETISQDQKKEENHQIPQQQPPQVEQHGEKQNEHPQHLGESADPALLCQKQPQQETLEQFQKNVNDNSS